MILIVCAGGGREMWLLCMYNCLFNYMELWHCSLLNTEAGLRRKAPSRGEGSQQADLDFASSEKGQKV